MIAITKAASALKAGDVLLTVGYGDRIIRVKKATHTATTTTMTDTAGGHYILANADRVVVQKQSL